MATKQNSSVCKIYDTMAPQWLANLFVLDKLQTDNMMHSQVDTGSASFEWQMEGKAELLPSGGNAEAKFAEAGSAAAIRSRKSALVAQVRRIS